jgi:hypothetical protein
MPLNFWDFTKLPSFEAIYIGRYASVGVWKKPVHSFKLEDKTVIHVWGSAMLNHLLYGVPFGSKMRITYKGKGKTEDIAHLIHIYEVETLEII